MIKGKSNNNGFPVFKVPVVESYHNDNNNNLLISTLTKEQTQTIVNNTIEGFSLLDKQKQRKRQKRKRQRQRKRINDETKKSNLQSTNTEYIIGINSITNALEKQLNYNDEQKKSNHTKIITSIMILKNGTPSILYKHLLSLCEKSNTKCLLLNDTNKLAKVLNIKTLTAFAICSD